MKALTAQSTAKLWAVFCGVSDLTGPATASSLVLPVSSMFEVAVELTSELVP